MITITATDALLLTTLAEIAAASRPNRQELDRMIRRLSEPAQDVGRLLLGRPPRSQPVEDEVLRAVKSLREGARHLRAQSPRRT